MPSKRRFTIITGYHFNSSECEANARLRRCLWALAREVGENGRIILIANGTEKGAQDPAQVIHGLGHLSSVKIEPVILYRNTAGNVQMWNAGVAMALAFPLESGDEWIGCVTCSTVLQHDWFRNVESCLREGDDVAFGRLLLEDDPQRILNDGHYLKDGRTYDFHRLKPKEGKLDKGSCPIFPCLSAAIFRKSLVEVVVKRYGNFVCENLSHYGDCTDVALRMKAVNPNAGFRFCVGAEAIKRRPILNEPSVSCSQLLAASLYYDQKPYGPKRISAEKHLKTEFRRKIFVDAVREADWRYHSYSPKDAVPPSVPDGWDNADGVKGKGEARVS